MEPQGSHRILVSRVLLALDRDALRFGTLVGTGDPYGQHTGVIGRRDRVAVDLGRQLERSTERPVAHLAERASVLLLGVLVAALTRAASPDRPKVLAALDEVTTEGANGDERGFNEHNHEGVIDDDVYFARFHDMTVSPVKDDPLSATLPELPQRQ